MNREHLRQFAEKADAPFFVYDLPAIAKHLAALPTEGLRVFYACKANPLSAVLDVVADSGLSFDVASLGELEQVLSCGVPADCILLTGPAKTRALLERALDVGVVHFAAESFEQLHLLDALARERNVRPRILLRLQLDWESSGFNPLGGNDVSVFGLEPDAWAQFSFSTLQAVQVVGFHVFQWGNILDADRLIEIWTHIAHTAVELAQSLKIDFQILDFGGGLGIPYGENQPALDWVPLVAALARLRKAGGWRESWLEPGRYAVGPFGTYLARIVDRKSVRGEDLVILEGGINHLMRPALVSSFPCSALADKGGEAVELQIHGPLCTALDKLGRFTLPADLKVGDWLTFESCGAYGFTESMPYFLCHAIAGEAVLRENGIGWIRPPELPQSWLK